MAETPEKLSDDNFYKDRLVVRHSDERTEEIPVPEGDVVLRIGRELDNNIVLTDPRSSRHHAEIRRQGDDVEIKDLNSANGTLINQNRIEGDTWTKVLPGQTIQLAETKIFWQKAPASQSTVAMPRQHLDTAASTTPAVAPVPVASPPPVGPVGPAPAPAAQRPTTSVMPWAIGLGAVLLLLILGGLAIFFLSDGTPAEEVAGTTPPAEETQAVVAASPTAGREAAGSLDQQSTSAEPTDTPTPTGPQLAIPVVEITSLQVTPIIFGASPSTDNAYIFIDVRVRNNGNIPFIFSIGNFSLRSRDGQQEFPEAGANTSENYLQQLGAIDRFKDLALTPGGSVPGSLVFDLTIDTYDLELVFEAPDVEPVVLGLGSINMARELNLAAGTPLAALEADATEEAEEEGETERPTPTPTIAPTPTATRPPEIPAPQVVARSALVGEIAFPAFNGTTYDLYIGDVATSETRFFRAQASQPAFSPDGNRIAFHSWDNASRGLIAIDVSGANGHLVANFVEDQLPTWSPDGSEIIFLSRRSGDRKSNLLKTDASTELGESTIIGEGEYPTVSGGQLLFKGWGNTAFGLRQGTPAMQNIETVTNVEEDTAPMLSPDGQQVVFMSRREENWDIYVVNLDGSGLTRLTDDPAQDGLPVWSPDGNAIAFVSDRGGIWAIWVMTPDGKGQSQLFTIPGGIDGFVGSDTYASRGWAEERISWTD